MIGVMTAKERVIRAFNHEEPDRVPLDYHANPGIDGRLKAHFTLAANNDEGLRRALGIDFRSVNPRYCGPKLHEDIPERQIDQLWGFHKRWIEHESGGYWDFCDFPLKDADVETAERWPMPNPDDFDYEDVLNQCERHESYAIGTGGSGSGDIINKAGMIRTMEQTFIDLLTDDPVFNIITDRRLEVGLEVMKRTLELAAGRIDYVNIAEDLGTQRSPIISLELFRKQIRPRLQRFVDVAVTYDLPDMIHSCGSSSWAFEDFIDMGIRVVDTLQPEAKDMSPAYLKKTFGDRLAFHGCISTAGPVSQGTVEETREDVRNILEIMKPGGGYCLSPTHHLQDNSPTENVLAMYEAAKEFGGYR